MKNSSFLFFLLLLIAPFFYSCENNIENVKILTSQNTLPTESAKDIEVIYSDSSIIRVNITAPLFERYLTENPYLEFPKGVKVLFFNNMGGVESKLSANHALSYERERRMEAKGNVIVINEKGEQLNTEHLIWDESKKKIHTTEFVKITTPEEIIYGKGFEANQNFTQYRIFNIKGTIHLKEN